MSTQINFTQEVAQRLYSTTGTTASAVRKEVSNELAKAVSEGRVSKEQAKQIRNEAAGLYGSIARQNMVRENVEAFKNGDTLAVGRKAATILKNTSLDIDSVVELAKNTGGEDFKFSTAQRKEFMEALNKSVAESGGKPLSKGAVTALLNGLGFATVTKFDEMMAKGGPLGLLITPNADKDKIATEVSGKPVSPLEAEMNILRDTYNNTPRQIAKG